MTNSKNKFAGVLLAALMTVSAVGAPNLMTNTDLTEPVSIVQTIEANAAYSTGKYQVNTKAGINVRNGAGTNYKLVGAATNATQFVVTKTSGNWGYTSSIKCTNGTKSGWVCLDYCKKVNGDNYVTPLTNGAIYYISPACAPGYLLDISGGASNKKDGANVQIYTAHWGTNQQFKAILQKDGSYIFEAVSSGKVLDVNIKTDNVTQWTKYSGNNQKWYLKNAGNGYYYVVYYWNTGYCLDVNGAGSKDGTNIQIYPSNGTNAQKFKFSKKETTYTGYVATKSAPLVLRGSASTSGKQLALMPKGSKVTVLDNKKQTNGFYHITYNGKTGYASAQYISFDDIDSISDNTALSYGLYHNNSARITCPFDGYTTTPGRHEGIDISCYVGAPIYSLTDGEVVRVAYGSNGSSGLSTIAIYVPSQNKTVIYLHSAPSNLKAGQKITKGQQIGTQAWRGVSSKSGSHTHVEVRNGRQGYASKSVNDYTLDNPNPTSFWKAMGYYIG